MDDSTRERLISIGANPADLRWANLSGANLSRADLSGATGLIGPADWMADNFEREED